MNKPARDLESRSTESIANELNEAEIQILASVQKAESSTLSTERGALEKDGARYWLFKEDWSAAFSSLTAKGLLEGNDDNYRLSSTGRPLGIRYYAERPDMYWYYYRQFYPAARVSNAHSKLCERVFGLDLTQEGMCDMPALHHLLQLMSVRMGQQVLDLGCGAGVIAEYVADKTGANVTGLDYAAPAITEAQLRTENKRPQLDFVNGDMNNIDLPERTFDTVISLDSLYWVADLKAVVAQIVKLLRPGGQMGIFMLDNIPHGRTVADFDASETPLGRTLSELGLTFEAYDYTIENSAFWHRNYRAAKDLQDEFEAEGNGFISASLIRESEEDFLPFIESGTLVRYLYHVRL